VKTVLVSLMALAVLTARGEDVAGHYVLHGVMEVGSELLLKADGRFRLRPNLAHSPTRPQRSYNRSTAEVVLCQARRQVVY
jgi:hypothetical protein